MYRYCRRCRPTTASNSSDHDGGRSSACLAEADTTSLHTSRSPIHDPCSPHNATAVHGRLDRWLPALVGIGPCWARISSQWRLPTLVARCGGTAGVPTALRPAGLSALLVVEPQASMVSVLAHLADGSPHTCPHTPAGNRPGLVGYTGPRRALGLNRPRSDRSDGGLGLPWHR